MEDQRAQDEFERIKLHQDIEKARMLIEQYATGSRFQREIESNLYTIGRLDERWGRGMTMDVDQHIQALRDLLVEHHETYIAEIQQRADDAAARGDEWYRKWHQDHVERLMAMTYPLGE